MEQVRIEYFGHSCFRVTGCGQRIVLDPYEDGCVPGCPKLRLDAEFVYCSHEHSDHHGVRCVRIHDAGICSYESEDFASYRRNGPSEASRQTLSGIVLL